jgi:hypothetical protein
MRGDDAAADTPGPLHHLRRQELSRGLSQIHTAEDRVSPGFVFGISGARGQVTSLGLAMT